MGSFTRLCLVATLSACSLPAPSTTREPARSSLSRDEFVLSLYRYPHRESGGLRYGLEAVVFEREIGDQSQARRLLQRLVLRKTNRSEAQLSEANRANFLKASDLFLADVETRKRVDFRLGGQLLRTTPSSAETGWIREAFSMPMKACDGALGLEVPRAQLHPASPTRTDCRAAESTVGVISDVDDMIKDSRVLDKPELLWRTFFEDFAPVASTVELLKRETTNGSLHFVSSSPWQLYPKLNDGIAAALGHPDFELHLRPLRIKREEIHDFLNFPTFDYKVETIERILKRFPQKRFVLVGDTGEKDPEVYARIQADHPERIVRIFLRRVPGADHNPTRFRMMRNLRLYD